MGNIVFNNQVFEVSYDKEELMALKEKVISNFGMQGNAEYYQYDVPYMVFLIDRLLLDDVEAVREIYSPDISKDFLPIKREINVILTKLRSNNINLDEKILLTDNLRDLYLSLKYKEILMRSAMNYYFELMNIVRLTKVNNITKELK